MFLVIFYGLVSGFALLVGAILAMLADSMIQRLSKPGGISLFTIFGFLASFVIPRTSGFKNFPLAIYIQR